MLNGKKYLVENSQIMNKDYITQNQELPESIRLLAAMRSLYGKAKRIRLFRVGLTILIPIISVMCIKFFPSAVEIFALLSAIWLIFNRIYFQDIEKKIVKNAAKIQEEFDTNLFQINWNETLVGGKVQIDSVIKLNKSFKGERDKLKEWYPGLKASNHFSNVLLAQRTNIAWDIELRKFYRNLLIGILTFYFLSLTLIGYFSTISFQGFIISFIIPSLPLVLHLFETAKAHKERYEALESVATKITNQLANSLDENIDIKCRAFQDSIFLKRCDINTVPDKVYWIKRITYDKLAKDVNEDYSDQ